MLALVVALALQIGVNYANDYSDGIRGTDDARVGPVRLVGVRAGHAAGRCSPPRSAASASPARPASSWRPPTSWWLLLSGAAAIAAAWFYTGGSRPYGYRGARRAVGVRVLRPGRGDRDGLRRRWSG